MRYLCTFIFLLCVSGFAENTMAQSINFEDGFEDGDFTNSPAWSGDTGDFTVVEDEPNFLLQLDATGTTPSYLSTSSSNVEGYWQFYIEFRGFEPSGSNQAEIFLMSDNANLEGTVNGYAIQVGETGDDLFRLVRYDNGSEEATVITGTTVVQSGGGYTIRVNRDNSGNWQMQVAEGYGLISATSHTGTDNTHTAASHFGTKINFTSSRSDLFYLDFKIDLPPFVATDVRLSDTNTVDVSFNRAPDQTTVESSDFFVNNGTGSPVSVAFTSPDTARLSYSQALPADQYLLSVNEIIDQFGNTIQSDSLTFFVFDSFATGDVKINEVMSDPPSGQAEYVELINTTDKYLNLANWEIGDDGGTETMTTDPIPLQPNGFRVISADTTSLFNAYGSRNYHLFSGLATLNNGSDAVQLITKNGMLADSLFYTTDWGGTNVALERRSTSAASIYSENWGDSPNSRGGTPGQPNEISSDDTPPHITALNILSPQTLKLAFDERLDQAGSYSITNVSINSVSLPAPDTVELSLGANLQDAQDYTLSISDAEDIFGNLIPPTDTTFTFYNPSPVDSGDVFLNEFSYDPPSGDTEYIELYNTTDKSFDLQEWTLSDNRGTPSPITTSRHIVPPDSFVVVAPDNTLLSNHPDISLVAMSGFPSLNNSGDQIIIRDDSGAILDSLQYSSEWGGNEVALERRTTEVDGTFSENWGNAPNGTGTPGSANEITADNTPPFFEELYAIDPTTLQLVFSERITASSATDPQNYQVSPGKNIQLISARNDSVTLYLSSELTSETTYEVTATDISDVFGNTLSGATKKFEFLKIDAAYPGDIVINEILYNPGSEGKVDFVEIYNTTSKNFDISNWHIADGSSKATLPQNIQLPANSYLVLTGGDRFASTINNALDVDDFPSYNNNSGDDVYLETDNGRTIDSLRYATSWGGSEEGTSLERKDPKAASNDASNWQTSGTGSAGSQNISFQEDTSPPVVIFSKALPNGQIEVRFNEFIQLTPDLKFSTDNKQLQIASFDSTRGNVIFLSGGSSKSQNSLASESTITVENLSDVKGNTTESTEVAVAQPMQPSNLVINEIMFNPLDEPDDNRPDQSEYIELRNTQDYAISLEGLFLHDAPDEDSDTRDLLPVTSTAKWVPAQGHVLVHADPVISFKDSKVAQFFDLATTDMHSIMRVDRSSLSLASSGDAIFIADSTGATIDSVYYGESWHNPNIIDTRGVALERVSPSGPSDDETNWGSSVNARGGTPNSENSIYQENTRQPQDTGISFEPNPFSPDGDGYQDNLFINYKLDQQDYLIDVHIYDRYGRMVRELADGKQAGLQGQLIWNGRKDDGGRNRIGIYIVVFEAYDSVSGNRKSFKKTVVLARRVN